MPEGYTHVRVARRAAEQLQFPVSCPEVFAAGANGPDSFFCFEVWKKAAKRRFDLPALGNRMHSEATGAFLQCLVARAVTRAQQEYTLGFLSHYATDAVIHPYVYAMQQPGMPYSQPGGHGYFEIALDSTLHAGDTGISDVPAKDTSPRIPGAELAEVCALLHDCLAQVYGEDIPVEYLADSFYHTYRMRSLFLSRHGIKYRLFWLIEPLFGGRGFITGHVSPRQLALDLPDRWRDPATGEQRTGNVFALLERAQERSYYYMCAALSRWQGGSTQEQLAEMLGSVDYGTGTETEESLRAACGADGAQQPLQELLQQSSTDLETEKGD